MTKFGKEKVVKELKEALEDKLVTRREAPLLGAIFFSICLWGSKLFTSNSPGTSLYFEILGYPIHFHHFHYGLIAIAVAVVLSFIEGPWPKRLKHIFFGAGFGFIVDEYWMLLIFDDSAGVYFSPQSLTISIWIGVTMTIVYGVIAVLSYFFTKKERELWEALYNAVKSGKVKIDI